MSIPGREVETELPLGWALEAGDRNGPAWGKVRRALGVSGQCLGTVGGAHASGVSGVSVSLVVSGLVSERWEILEHGSPVER